VICNFTFMLSLPEVRNFCWMFEEASMGVGLVVKRFGSFFMQVHLMFFFLIWNLDFLVE
jgi:hypothetical protein